MTGCQLFKGAVGRLIHFIFPKVYEDGVLQLEDEEAGSPVSVSRDTPGGDSASGDLLDFMFF